jgi:hypothetical protein
MGSIFEPDYGNSGTPVALTMTSLGSLSNGSYAGSAVVDNTTTLYEDALVGLTLASASSGVSASGIVFLYVYSDVDGTPHYTDGVTGTDAGQSPTSPTNLRFLGAVNVVANSTTYYAGRFSVARAFGGWMPKKWGIVALNSSGAALASSGSSANFLPINEQLQ